jgi:hypothetical protein
MPIEKKLDEVKISGKKTAPLDWQSNPLRIENWRGLAEECIAASGPDPFSMFSPPLRVLDSKKQSDDDDVRELLRLLMRAVESGDDEERGVADDGKKRAMRRKPEHNTRVANDSMPSANESITSWIARLATRIDVSHGPRAALFRGLRAYSSRFDGRQFSDLATADRNALHAFVNRIREAA